MTKKVRSIPKTLGACADQLYKLREQRQALNKQVKELQDQESQIKEHLIQNLPKSDASGVAGKLARASIATKEVASVKDWDKLYKHVLKTKDFSFLQRRVADAAVKDRWEDGKKVPGVEPFNVVSVSVTKI